MIGVSFILINCCLSCFKFRSGDVHLPVSLINAQLELQHVFDKATCASYVLWIKL